MRALQSRLAEHGVPFGHWTFLRILWAGDGLTQRELSDEAGVMEPTTFSALKSMEALGYITRRRKPENRKNYYVYLTPAGRALERALVPLAEEVNAIAVRGVPAAKVEAARETLLAVVANLSPPSPRRRAPPRNNADGRRGSGRRIPAASSRPRRSRAG